ncbi:ABC-type nitrate/sulfonate/bicarbonate transport system, periplasmic component [Opitutaceae bacterium TAV1]|nr:ABC-type nitrate/sulfonate/bicarbonate transport system, periplasmic component [Opitutaceae bacterium TAV1]
MRFVRRKLAGTARGSRADRLHVGFVPTLDCATLMVAQELGLFARHGVQVRLSREVGWATVREKLVHEELDAAATHASMLFSIYCGLGVVRRPCLTGLFLGANGSAITLSDALWNEGARDAATTAAAIRKRGPGRPATFGIVLGLSTQHLALRRWLASGGLDPERDVKIVIIPSGLIYESFRQGFIDGYCVAEPWNSAAIRDRLGWVAATSSDILPGHPEKALVVLQDFAERREEEHLRMIAALMEASRFCDDPANRPEVVRILARPAWFDLDPACLRNALVGPFDSGRGHAGGFGEVIRYDAFDIGAPSRSRGRQVLDMVNELHPQGDARPFHADIIGKLFRHDIYNQARALADPNAASGVAPARCAAVPEFSAGLLPAPQAA